MRASASEAALAKPSFVSGALSEQLTNQRLNLKLQPQHEADGRFRVVTYVMTKTAVSFSSGSSSADLLSGGGLSRRKKPLGMGLNPDYVEEFVSGCDVDKNCREVQAGIFWRNGDADFFEELAQLGLKSGNKRPGAGKKNSTENNVFVHADLFQKGDYKSSKTEYPSARGRGKSGATKARSRPGSATSRGQLVHTKEPTAANGKAMQRQKFINGTVPWDFEARIDDVTIYPLPARNEQEDGEDNEKQAASPAGRRCRKAATRSRPQTAPLRRQEPSPVAPRTDGPSDPAFTHQPAAAESRGGSPWRNADARIRDEVKSASRYASFLANCGGGGQHGGTSMRAAAGAPGASGATATTARQRLKIDSATPGTSGLLMGSSRIYNETSVYRSRRRFNIASRIHENRQHENAVTIPT
eukprot:CAMPEP_0179004094 /NCGR_PEP_ID=MMETSP0795-20121207/13086_1 /TAXON_ID=88552 /ORGANISM="Amoebophrya sp., Strain Ameob2" /LENGTH=412 /DNA_ID=CAMNT_0020698263 /DNA_START=188 /DNA_END=1427 /DNA_ORIENTATION=-